MLDLFKKKAKRLPDSFWMIATIIAAAQINYTIIHSTFVYVALFVMLIHDLCHYYTAKINKIKAKLPFFIPLPFFVVGVTRVAKMSDRLTKKVSFSGPLYGVITSILLLLLNTIFKFSPYLPIIAILIGEIVFNYIGTDGAKYRKAKRNMQLCTS